MNPPYNKEKGMKREKDFIIKAINEGCPSIFLTQFFYINYFRKESFVLHIKKAKITQNPLSALCIIEFNPVKSNLKKQGIFFLKEMFYFKMEINLLNKLNY